MIILKYFLLIQNAPLHLIVQITTNASTMSVNVHMDLFGMVKLVKPKVNIIYFIDSIYSTRLVARL